MASSTVDPTRDHLAQPGHADQPQLPHLPDTDRTERSLAADHYGGAFG